MSSYDYPPMPLVASVWWVHDDAQPSLQPDELVEASLSPVRPEDFYRATAPTAPSGSTHIIRCAPLALLADNYRPGYPGPLFPCTLFECPVDSAHYYATVWAHVVGAGFANEHARLYVVRWRFVNLNVYPLFQGWI